MTSLQIKAIVAGLCFGMWPLFMNRGGLSGNTSSMVLTGLILVIVSPFALADGIGSIANIKWTMVFVASVLAAIGMMSFNGMLAEASKEAVGTLFVLTILTQAVIPAVYQVVMDGSVSPMKSFGFVLAIVAATILCKS